MGLDITFFRRKKVACPHCGMIVTHTTEDAYSSSGRTWYPFLESIKYYIPYDQRTEENDWYGKDMILTGEQKKEAYDFLRKKNDVYEGKEIASMLAMAICESDDIVVNANW